MSTEFLSVEPGDHYRSENNNNKNNNCQTNQIRQGYSDWGKIKH